VLAQRETSCPECFGGWGVAGADGGDEAGEGAGGESDEWGGEDGGRVDGGGPSACGAGGDDAEEADAGAGDAGDRADEGGFDSDLAPDVSSFRAESSAEPDLAAAFDDVQQCRVRDCHGADEQRKAGQGEEQRGDVAGDLVAELLWVGWNEGLEPFGMVGA